VRQCRLCGETKSLAQFRITTGTNRRHVCNECRSLQKAGWDFELSVAEVRRLLAKRQTCEICGKRPVNGRLRIDHDHHTKKVRGVLCSNCNVGLGMFDDDPELLEQAAEYIRERMHDQAN
jgi:hypothetical protein